MVTARGALSLKNVRSPVLVLTLVGAVVIVRAQVPGDDSAAKWEGRSVSRVVFDPPNQPFPPVELEKLLPFHAGSVLHHADIRAAIDRMYQTGRFMDISIEGEADQNGVVTVRISTEPAYFVSRVSFVGIADPPTRGQLLTAAKLELGRPFSDGDLEQATENIEERFHANGLYHATVKTRVERNPDTEEVQIHFDLETGNRARVDGVTVLGNFTKSPASIIQQTHWRRGFGPFRLPGWREATESLMQRGVSRVLDNLQHGDHLQARVTLDRLDYHDSTNTVTPTLNIESGPILQVRTSGAKVPSGKLRQLVPIYQERAVDRSLVVEGRRNLLEYMRSQGFFDAQVEFSEATPEPGHQVIEYAIVPNQHARLVQVEIAGNRFFDTATLRERLVIAPAHFPRNRFGRFSQKLLERDLDSIRDLYQSSGFREVDIATKTETDYNGKPGDIAVRIDIKEGVQWFVDALTIEGVPEPDLPYLRTILQSTANQPFSESNIGADRDSILSYYYNNGYPDASFDWTQSPGSSQSRVNLTYQVHTGNRRYVRDVLVRGLRTTRPSLVDKRIPLRPGDPISQSKIAESQQKLYDLGVFSKVQTAIQNPDGDEDNKFVLYDVDEANRYSFNIGIGAQLGRIGGGVTTFDEPAGTTGFSPRISLGISRLNLFGLARTLSLQTRFSTIEQRALLSYTAPQLGGYPNLTLTVSGLFDVSHDVRTFAARRWEGSIQLAQRLTRANSVQYRFTYRNITTSDLVVSPELIPLFSQPDHVALISTTFIQDRRDDPINSHRGIYNTVDAGVAVSGFGSETQFTRVLMRNSTYHPIGKDIVIARTLQFGWIQRIGGLPEIPLAERFFAGGATSNRAFPDNQAGPRDLDTGFPLGGSALLMHSTELRFPLIGDNLGGVLFHDIGNVYSDVQHISFRFRQRNNQDFNYGVQGFGFGIRYRTPIGPIRVDLSLSPDAPRFFGFKGTFDQLLAGQGIAVNQKINAFQFHFSLGQTF
jgi:outer membrane protein assembly complex protein YaeT